MLNRGDEGNVSNTFTRSKERKKVEYERKSEFECSHMYVHYDWKREMRYFEGERSYK